MHLSGSFIRNKNASQAYGGNTTLQRFSQAEVQGNIISTIMSTALLQPATNISSDPHRVKHSAFLHSVSANREGNVISDRAPVQMKPSSPTHQSPPALRHKAGSPAVTTGGAVTGQPAARHHSTALPALPAPALLLAPAAELSLLPLT